MVPRVGQKIGPYEILGRLGSGGMGLVFSAWDSRLQRDVAIKLLREEFATPSMRQRFLQEARAASRLNHANICTIFDIGEQEGDPYLVMELLKGETVRGRLARGLTSAEELVQVGSEVADALTVAHGRGIIHRDIKPANIILVEKTNGFQSKVLDFGLAKVEDSLDMSKHDLTSAGTTVGTVAYMSPEQAKGEQLDARSDLFSLGVVMYEMATGELPFQGATSALVFVQLLGHRPEPIRDFNPDIPKDLDKVIMMCLEKKRTDRYQSAADLVEALGKIQFKKGGSSKSLWGTKPSKGWGARSDQSTGVTGSPKRDPEPSKASTDSSKWGILGKPGDPSAGFGAGAASKPADLGSSKPAGTNDAFLRPVKRIVPNDVQATTPRPESGSAIRPPAALPPAAVPRSPSLPPTASSGMHRTAPLGSPLGSSGAHTPARSRVPASSEEIKSAPATVQRASGAEMDRALQSASPTARMAARATQSRFRVPEAGAEGSPRGSSRSHTVAAERDVPEEKKSGKGGLIALVVVLLVVVGGGFAWYQTSHSAAPAGNVPTSLLLCSMKNNSLDTPLDGLFHAGLELALDESPHVSVRGEGDCLAGMNLANVAASDDPSPEDAQQAARKLGVSNVALGHVTRGGPSSYDISVDLYDVASGKKVTSANEVANSRDQVSQAIDRIAADVRSGLGESGDSIANASVPLNHNASDVADAYGPYWQGYLLSSQGQLAAAASQFKGALQKDSHFSQANLQLADIYRRQSAELSASDAAVAAQSELSVPGTRTEALVQASYTIYKEGDYTKAIADLQQLCTAYPADLQAHLQLALAQRLAGKFADSLTTAEEALKIAPHDEQATGAAETAMIALGQVDKAKGLEAESKQYGHVHAGIAVLIDMLTSAPVPPAEPTKQSLTAQMRTAEVQDAGGQFSAGLISWRGIVEQAKQADLPSAASYALGHAALDRALALDCTSADSLAKEAMEGGQGGPDATYSAGLAAALCGDLATAKRSKDSLTAGWPKSFAATTFYLPNLTAAMSLKSDAADGLAALEPGRPSDQLSIAPYLRGLLDAAKQPKVAIADYQQMQTSSGAVSLVLPEAFPMAQFAIARATGDAGQKSVAYRKFLKLWTNPDPKSAVYLEALSGSR